MSPLAACTGCCWSRRYIAWKSTGTCSGRHCCSALSTIITKLGVQITRKLVSAAGKFNGCNKKSPSCCQESGGGKMQTITLAGERRVQKLSCSPDGWWQASQYQRYHRKDSHLWLHSRCQLRSCTQATEIKTIAQLQVAFLLAECDWSNLSNGCWDIKLFHSGTLAWHATTSNFLARPVS